MTDTMTEAACRYRTALERFRASDEGDTATRMEWHAARSEVRRIVRQAMEEGIAEAAEHPVRHDRIGEPPPITPLERGGAEAIVGFVTEYFAESDLSDAGQLPGLAAYLGYVIARDELLRKVLAAWDLEHAAMGHAPGDGIVGRAVDEAIEALNRYEELKEELA